MLNALEDRFFNEKGTAETWHKLVTYPMWHGPCHMANGRVRVILSHIEWWIRKTNNFIVSYFEKKFQFSIIVSNFWFKFYYDFDFYEWGLFFRHSREMWPTSWHLEMKFSSYGAQIRMMRFGHVATVGSKLKPVATET